MIAGIERDPDERAVDRPLAAPQPVKRGLELVDESGERGKSEHRPRALDRMQGAKGRIDEIAVTGRLLEIEEIRFERLEKFARFLAEGFGRILTGHAPATFLMTARS